MKKKRFVGMIGVALATVMLCSVFLSGCGLFGGDNNNDDNNNTTPTEYTIQYTDDLGSHTLTVTDGAAYSLEAVPERLGYDFIGLFDAKVGGTQYVDETGQSLAPFTDKKNMVLFPQFAAKEYTIVLDYQGATVTGQRSVTVKYGEKLPELPKNLSKEHSVFAGWYTKANCGGIQVADNASLIPDKSTVNENLFDIEGAGEYLYLYAGFNVETFTVTFNFGNGIPSEEVEVEYNTPISEVVPETRNSEGQAVLSWSKTSSGEQIFTGNITDNTVLYAVEWAPVIELDSNGGETIAPVVAREGASVALPTPVRDNYKFMHWETMSGDVANITSMPAEGAQLKAVWQAMLVFDENGGTAVQDISQAAGTAIILPTPEKEGFIFAGWYTADEEKYTISSMPVASVELKAGWYESKSVSKTMIPSDDSLKLNGYWSPTSETYQISLASLVQGLDVSSEMDIQVKLTFSTKHEVSETYPEQYNPSISCTLSRSTTVSSSDTYLSRTFASDYLTAWQKREIDANITINNGLFYIIFKVFNANGNRVNANVWVSNLVIDITYPDTSNLYL